MHLNNGSVGVESAATYITRECIAAGVAPGLQNLRHGCSRPRVAARELAAGVDRRDGCDRDAGDREPGRFGREEGPVVAGAVATRASRFWRHIDRSGGESACWPWLGAIEKTGYGRVNYDGKAQMAHRVAHVIAKGLVPDGLHVDHLCRNRCCCNPAHLEAVTQRENTLRGNAPNAIGARTNRCRRGHDLTRARRTSTGGRDCPQCKVLRNRAWRERRSGEVGVAPIESAPLSGVTPDQPARWLSGEDGRKAPVVATATPTAKQRKGES
jgi:hypothetical protein